MKIEYSDQIYPHEPSFSEVVNALYPHELEQSIREDLNYFEPGKIPLNLIIVGIFNIYSGKVADAPILGRIRREINLVLSKLRYIDRVDFLFYNGDEVTYEISTSKEKFTLPVSNNSLQSMVKRWRK